MYIDTSKTTINGKTYYRYLFRESYREDGKVKNRTLGKISKCSEEEVAAMKLALKHKKNLSALLNIEEVELHDGPRVGVVFALKALAERLDISKALGSSREGKLALWQVMARLIGDGSHQEAVRMAASYGACDVLELESFSADDLSTNLAWLTEHQVRLETQLFKHNSAGAGQELVLEDVITMPQKKQEHAFQTFRQSRPEIGPVEAGIGGQKLVIMLACNIERLLSELWKECDCTVQQGIDELCAIRSTIVTIGEASCQKIPQSTGVAGELLAAAGVTLPSIIEAKNSDAESVRKLTIKRD